MTQRTAVNQIMALRHAVLWAGQPIERAAFKEDISNGTRHYAVFTLIKPEHGQERIQLVKQLSESTSEAVSCVSLILTYVHIMELRGLATDPEYQRQGIADHLMAWSENDVILSRNKVTKLWSNVRINAVPFFEKKGWEKASAAFKLPFGGKHIRMIKKLNRIGV